MELLYHSQDALDSLGQPNSTEDLPFDVSQGLMNHGIVHPVLGTYGSTLNFRVRLGNTAANTVWSFGSGLTGSGLTAEEISLKGLSTTADKSSDSRSD